MPIDDEGASGFVAAGATVGLIDDVLERAWQKREQWQEMGRLAGQHIRERYPADPILEFANQIRGLAGLDPVLPAAEVSLPASHENSNEISKRTIGWAS